MFCSLVFVECVVLFVIRVCARTNINIYMYIYLPIELNRIDSSTISSNWWSSIKRNKQHHKNRLSLSFIIEQTYEKRRAVVVYFILFLSFTVYVCIVHSRNDWNEKPSNPNKWFWWWKYDSVFRVKDVKFRWVALFSLLFCGHNIYIYIHKISFIYKTVYTCVLTRYWISVIT